MEISAGFTHLHLKRLRKANRASSLSAGPAVAPYHLFRVVGSDAVTLQFSSEFGEMLMVPCLNCAKDVDRRNIRTGERAIVDDLFDARPSRRDLGREIREPTGSIANDGGESAQPPVRDQTALDHSAAHVGIDVYAAKYKDPSIDTWQRTV